MIHRDHNVAEMQIPPSKEQSLLQNNELTTRLPTILYDNKLKFQFNLNNRCQCVSLHHTLLQEVSTHTFVDLLVIAKSFKRMESNSNRPTIMVTNDDRIDGDGLQALVQVLGSTNLYQVFVCFPEPYTNF